MIFRKKTQIELALPLLKKAILIAFVLALLSYVYFNDRIRIDRLSCNKASQNQMVCHLETSSFGLNFTPVETNIQFFDLHKVLIKIEDDGESRTTLIHFLNTQGEVLYARQNEHWTNKELYVCQINSFIENPKQISTVVTEKLSFLELVINIIMDILVIIFVFCFLMKS